MAVSFQHFGSRGTKRKLPTLPSEGAAMITWFHDLRYAFRQLRKSPLFTIIAVLTLAVAIGANAVAFGALDALILRSIDVPNAQSLYVVGRANDMFGYESYLNYLDLRHRNRSFEGLAADNIAQAGLDTGEGPTRAWGYEASGNFFDVLGLSAARIPGNLHSVLWHFLCADREPGTG
jgi:hypothetical protein